MKWLNKLFNYLISLIIISYGVFFFYGDSFLKYKQAGQTELSSNDVDQAVNKYLKQATAAMQKSRYDSDAAVKQALKQPLVLTTDSKEIDPADVPVAKQIWKESDVNVTPAEVVTSSIYDENAFAQQDEQERKQYAKDFIENARRGGYHVVLSNDLTKIVSVTPIRKPSGQNDSVESFPSN